MKHLLEDGMFLRQEGIGGRESLILYLHGLGESGLCFEALAAHLELGGWRHLIPDLPGYGRSPWEEKPSPLEALADRLARWLQSRGEPPAVVLGHSMGGVLGILFAERHPGLVRALVDVEGNLSPGDCVFSSVAARRSLEAFLARGFSALQERVRRDGRDNPALRGYLDSMRLCDPRELVALSSEERLARRLAALPLPRFYVAGLPGGVCSRSLELLREAEMSPLAVSPSGHWPFIDQPERFVQELRGILDSLDATA
jgi:pimeloyl-ACP methyl ester carboxylesterase